MQKGGHTALVSPIQGPHPPAHSDQSESFREFSKLEMRVALSLGLKAVYIRMGTQACWPLSSELQQDKGQNSRVAKATRLHRQPKKGGRGRNVELPSSKPGPAACLYFCRLPQGPSTHGRHTAFLFMVKLVWVEFLSLASNKALIIKIKLLNSTCLQVFKNRAEAAYLGCFGSSLLEGRVLDQLTSSAPTPRVMLEKDVKVSTGLSVPGPILQLEVWRHQEARQWRVKKEYAKFPWTLHVPPRVA